MNDLDTRLRHMAREEETPVPKDFDENLTRTLAQGLAPDIRVNAIGPGPTLRGARQSDEHFARQRAATILERGAGPEDICAALGYLMDAPAVTGQLLCVDGGQHLAWRTPDILGVE